MTKSVEELNRSIRKNEYHVGFVSQEVKLALVRNFPSFGKLHGESHVKGKIIKRRNILKERKYHRTMLWNKRKATRKNSLMILFERGRHTQELLSQKHLLEVI